MRSPTGVLRASAQNRVMKDDGRFEYLSLRQDQVDEVRRMRLARRGKQLNFLYAHDVSQPDRLLGRYVVPDEEIAALFTRLMVHTGGAERVTEAAWKKLSIHAEKVTPVQ